MQEQSDTAVASRYSVWTAQLNAQAENAVANKEGPLQAELNTAVQRAATAEERANSAVATEIAFAFDSIQRNRSGHRAGTKAGL